MARGTDFNFYIASIGTEKEEFRDLVLPEFWGGPWGYHWKGIIVEGTFRSYCKDLRIFGETNIRHFRYRNPLSVPRLIYDKFVTLFHGSSQGVRR